VGGCGRARLVVVGWTVVEVLEVDALELDEDDEAEDV